MSGWWARPRQITVCVDTPGWFDPFAERLVAAAKQNGDRAEMVRRAADVRPGAIAFYLSCMKITPDDVLARNRLNVVVHASALPHGRGFSPIVWQVLEGRNSIPVTMIEAASEADSGDVLMTDQVALEGHELNSEIRTLLGETVLRMCTRLLDAVAPPMGRRQEGEGSWYAKRGPADSRLDPAKTIEEQFDLLRVVDNERYPAFFDLRGHRYVLKIEKADVAGGASRDRADATQLD